MKKSGILPAPFGQRTIIRPRRSTTLVITTIAVYLVVMLASILAAPPLPVICSLVLVLGVTMVQAVRAMTTNQALLSLSPGGRLLLQMDNTQWVRMEVEKSLVSSWLVVIGAKAVPAGKPYLLIYLPDSMDSMSFRRLKVYLTGLRWQQGSR